MAEKHDGFIYEQESIVPDNLTPLPVGTLDELQKEGLDPASVGCCHRKVTDGEGNVVILGCKYRIPDVDNAMAICQLEDRDVSGPHNYGVKQTKGKAQGGAVIRAQRDCFWIAANKRSIEANGGLVQLVAWEPDGVDDEGKPTRSDGKPVTFTTIEVGPGDGLKPVYMPRPVTKTVEKFLRPGENPEMANEVLKALERSDAEKEKLVRRGEGFAS